MGYTARAIANYFLDLARADGKSISPLKVQKLVFVAHGWYLALVDEPLVDDEYAEAWDYGPVFPSIYHAFKHFGRSPIRDRATKLEIADRLSISKITPAISADDKTTRSLLDQIWRSYGHLSGLQLSDMTHAEGTPWHTTKATNSNVRNADIDNNVIKAHYTTMAEKNRERREQPSNG